MKIASPPLLFIQAMNPLLAQEPQNIRKGQQLVALLKCRYN